MIITGHSTGNSVLIPRIPIISSDNPFQFKQLQFPVPLSFAMSINKSQGQSLKVVGLDLQKPSFSHGQLYVGCSKVDVNTVCDCGNGLCVEEDGKAVCKCKPTYGFIETQIKCIACNCGEGWNCTYSFSGSIKTCICTNGYKQKGNGTDKMCVGPCTNNPCGKGGTCVDVAPGMYKCDCLEGFTGRNCKDIVKTPCSSNPCMNGAVCKIVDKSYECKCTTGFVGKNCDKDDICYNNPGICRNGGTCETTLSGRFKCNCLPGFSDTRCREGCEEIKGSKICKAKGEHWICVNKEQDKSSYSCICEPGYKLKNSNCIVDASSSTEGISENSTIDVTTKSPTTALKVSTKQPLKSSSTSSPTSTLKVSTEQPLKSSASPTTTETSTTEDQKEKCDCGENSYACQWNRKGAQLCSCFPGYAQLENICSECHCGRNTASCFFDQNERNICICRDGFAQRNGTCSKICRSSAECLNGGQCSSDGHESFCKCMPPYTGDRCEINEICKSMNGACDSIGSVCHYIHSIKQGFCICPPNKIFNKDSKRCEDKFEITSIFFIILCLSTVLLLLSIVIIIILLKKFRKKLESINVKSP
nr:neurogenic locus Notch protein-like [Parasteatoda tepidariorum]